MEQDSFDSFDDIEEMVMAANNLSLSPNGAMSGDQRDSLNVSGEEDELPKSIIVTNVDLSVFDNLDVKVIKMPLCRAALDTVVRFFRFYQVGYQTTSVYLY